MSHTPGPWRQNRNMIEDEYGGDIAAVLYQQSDYVQGNIRLIAAAPRMREFIVEYLARLDVKYAHDELALMARALLREIEGKEATP